MIVKMTVITEDTKYSGPEIIDVNPLRLQALKNPLIIVARDAQKIRLLKWVNAHKGTINTNIKVLGWWELDKGYLNQDAFPIDSAFQSHDAVVFVSPERVYPPARPAFKRLIQYIAGL